MNARSSIELFHLVFLRHFADRVERNLYAVKGGCNLRFFFQSIRYSEDLDLDIQIVLPDTLRNHVRKVFKSQSFVQQLYLRGLSIDSVSEPKQTETTQRWKVAISSETAAAPIPSKIEFSRRAAISKSAFDLIDAKVITDYKLYPIAVSHYSLDAAVSQKISALAGRTETQARDVFDLDHLLTASRSSSYEFDGSTDQKAKAIECVHTLTFQDYLTQVVDYFPDTFAPFYGTEEKWNQMVRHVLESLKGLNS